MTEDEVVLVHTGQGGAGVAALVRSMLAGEGIHCVIKSESGAVGFNMMTPAVAVPVVGDGPLGLFDVYVHSKDAERARDLLTAIENDDQDDE